MHLSQLVLNPYNRQARLDLSDPYQMHRSLVRVFVSEPMQVPPRFLWRLEQSHSQQEPAVLLQSAQEPDFSELQSRPGYLSESPECALSSKSVDLERLVALGTHYRFRLVANPTVSRAGKRFGLVGEADQVAWLSRQGERYGFTPESAIVVNHHYIKTRKAGALLNLLRVQYEGLLCVRDAGRLRTALLAGIGPGKAFGCGLLSVARVRAE